MITLEMVRKKINELSEKNKLLKEQVDNNAYYKEEIMFARTDSLTSLPNANFLKRIFYLLNLYMIESILAKDNAFAIGYCDINGLKMINDTMGHHVGDDGIVEIVNIIKQYLRTSRDFLEDDKLFFIGEVTDDMAIKYSGGDEFLLILPWCNKFEADTVVGQRIKESIRENLDKTQQLSLAIGFACTDEDWVKLPPDLEEENIMKFFKQLVTVAETRMYEDKKKMGQEGQYNNVAAYIRRFCDILGLEADNPEDLKKAITALLESPHDKELDLDIKEKEK